MADFELFKHQAAEHALQYIQSGMTLGLGTGSTATHMLHVLAEALHDGRLRDIVGVPTSDAISALARQLGVPIATLDERPQLDLALDGADEIDP
jgi:ribose 5-phosphate isomerase A